MPIQTYKKKKGETPLEALGRFRLEFPEYSKEKLSYAGRLDPMAEGELLVLIGESNKEREKYLGLEKEYQFEVLFGFESDSYDLLGIAKKSESKPPVFPPEKLVAVLKTFLGKRTQSYPPFSSKTVGGVPLHAIARSGKLDDVEIPTREVEILSGELLESREIGGAELLDSLKGDIALVQGDFRQGEILAKWSELLGGDSHTYQLACFRVHTSSGAYVRSLAHEMGKILQTSALAFSIKRSRIFM